MTQNLPVLGHGGHGFAHGADAERPNGIAGPPDPTPRRSCPARSSTLRDCQVPPSPREGARLHIHGRRWRDTPRFPKRPQLCTLRFRHRSPADSHQGHLVSEIPLERFSDGTGDVCRSDADVVAMSQVADGLQGVLQVIDLRHAGTTEIILREWDLR